MNEHEHDSRANNNTQQQAITNDSSHESKSHVSSSAGDEVLNILADVEKKFDRLREFQRKQEHELTSLEQRRVMLDETERELDQELNTLVEQRNALDGQKKQVEQQRDEIAKQRAELTQQQDALDTQRQELKQQAQLAGEKKQALEQRSAEIARQSEEVAQQRAQWNEHRQQAEAEQREQQKAMEQQRDELTRLDQAQRASNENVQQQREQLHAAQQQFEQQREQWKQKSSQREQELQNKASELEQQLQQLNAQKLSLEDEQLQLLALEEQLQLRETAVTERTSALEAQEAELEQRESDSKQREQQAAQQLESARQKLTEAQQQAQQWRDALEQAQSQTQQLEQDLETSRAAMQQTETDRDEARTQVSELIQDVERLGAEVEENRSAVAEGERRLGIAGEKLKHFAEILNEQSPQLERGAAAMAMVDDQYRQIEELSKQLAEALRAGNPDELRRKDQRIAELTEALRQARGQIGVDTSVADLQLEMAELSRQNDSMQAEVETAVAQAQRSEQQLQQQLEAQQSEQSRMQERQPAIDGLEAEHALAIQVLQSEHDEAVRKARSGREDQVRSLQEQLGKLQESLVESKQRGASSAGGTDVKAFQQRIAELEEQLSHSQSTGENSEQAKHDLRKKTKKLSAAAQHLSRRRQRLEQAKRLLQQRIERQGTIANQNHAQSSAVTQMDRDEYTKQQRAIESQRRELAEVRQFLSHSERELMKRWARPRAVANAGWLVFLSVISGVASWFAADMFFPAPVTASVTFAPQPANPTTFTADDAANWQRWHAEYVLSSDFQSALAKRCADRRLEPYGNESELAARLSKDLDIDLSEPKRLTASLHGDNRDQTQHLLDTLAGTLSLESARQMDRRADNAKAMPTDERKEAGRVMYASLSPAPPIHDRLRYVGPIFSGIMIALFAIMGIIYARLVRSKRVFESEQEFFTDSTADGELTAV